MNSPPTRHQAECVYRWVNQCSIRSTASPREQLSASPDRRDPGRVPPRPRRGDGARANGRTGSQLRSLLPTDGRRHRKTFRTQKAADAYERQMIDQREQGIAPSSDLSFFSAGCLLHYDPPRHPPEHDTRLQGRDPQAHPPLQRRRETPLTPPAHHPTMGERTLPAGLGRADRRIPVRGPVDDPQAGGVVWPV